MSIQEQMTFNIMYNPRQLKMIKQLYTFISLEYSCKVADTYTQNISLNSELTQSNKQKSDYPDHHSDSQIHG